MKEMQQPKRRILFVHSLNNYSGSPKVLRSIMDGVPRERYRIDLLTSSSEGFLTGMPGVRYLSNGYKWTSNTLLTGCLFVLSQVITFLKVLCYPKQNTLVYVNSIIPIGAIAACKLSGKRMLVHVHENPHTPKPLYRLLRPFVQAWVEHSIFVSDYLCQIAALRGKSYVVYNGIKLNTSGLEADKMLGKNLIMVSSLRKAKGVDTFVDLARRMPEYSFTLVLSATPSETEKWFAQVGSPSNMRVYPLHQELGEFYKAADLHLQLSKPSMVVETFGMTIVEAMQYGVPSVVPCVGGPAEIVRMTGAGVTCDTENLEKLENCIRGFLADPIVYHEYSEKCLSAVSRFSLEVMQQKLIEIIDEQFQR